jgi:hypothetical protein
MSEGSPIHLWQRYILHWRDWRPTSAVTAAILLAIMLVAGALSIYRVYSVPILQCPDENSHIDYAFSLYSAGGLLNARVPPASGWNVKYVAESWDWERISHLYTLHLSRSLNMRSVRMSEANKEPAAYGSKDLYDKIDKTAPAGPVITHGLSTQDNPWLMVGYPAGYYVLAALEMKAINLFTDSLTSMFFSVRLMSVAMLMIDILLAYLILRKMHARFPLAITAIFALLPMTAYVASCVQPDNLALTLVLSTWYFGLSIDGSRLDRVRVPVLSLAMALLLFTKFHFFPFAAGPIILRLVLKRLLSVTQAVATFLLPQLSWRFRRGSWAAGNIRNTTLEPSRRNIVASRITSLMLSSSIISVGTPISAIGARLLDGPEFQVR